jgi:Flp pilus assembly protein TadD
LETVTGASEVSGAPVAASNAKLGAAAWSALAICAAIVLGTYICIGRGARQELGTNPARAYYNLLVAGFRHGQLSLPVEVPDGLARLPDPYDPKANEEFRGSRYVGDRLHDLSYFRGRIYLYFGVTPAVVLFGPVQILTGYDVSHAQAVLLFSAIGFLASGALVVAIWQRYFPAVALWAACAGVLAVGLANSLPVVLHRPEVWEVAVTCGYAMMMLTFVAIWRALHSKRTVCWLALASGCFGLAVGARPALLLCAPVLALAAWHLTLAAARAGEQKTDRRRTLRLCVAAVGPLLVIGAALLAYNYLRFGDVLEFGQRYQLAGERQGGPLHFAVSQLWTNIRLYFLSTAGWSTTFPYVTFIPVPPLPPTHGGVEYPYGLLTNTPFVWLAMAVPFAWKHAACGHGAGLRALVSMLAFAFAIMAVALCCYYGTCVRYELEFSAALVLLAVIGWFGLHAAWSRGAAWRGLLRGIAAVALAYSIAFAVLYGWVHRALIERSYAAAMLMMDRHAEALATLQNAVRIAPGRGELFYMLGCAFTRIGDLEQGRAAVVRGLALNRNDRSHFVNGYAYELNRFAGEEQQLAQLEALARDASDVPEVENGLGDALASRGRFREALAHFQRAVRLRPSYADAQCSAGIALAKLGETARAAEALEAALKIDPNQYDAHVILGQMAAADGRMEEARVHFQSASRIETAAKAVKDEPPASDGP